MIETLSNRPFVGGKFAKLVGRQSLRSINPANGAVPPELRPVL